MNLHHILREGFFREYKNTWASLGYLSDLYGNPAVRTVVVGLMSGNNREFYAREYRRALQEATPHIECIERFFARFMSGPVGEFISEEKEASLRRAKEDSDFILAKMIEAFEGSRPQIH